MDCPPGAMCICVATLPLRRRLEKRLKNRRFSCILKVRLVIKPVFQVGDSLITNTTRFPKISLKNLERLIVSSLGDRKAEHVTSIDLTGKSDVADRMVVASGTSSRHVASLSDSVVEALKDAGYESVPVEGKESCEWVLVDA